MGPGYRGMGTGQKRSPSLTKAETFKDKEMRVVAFLVLPPSTHPVDPKSSVLGPSAFQQPPSLTWVIDFVLSCLPRLLGPPLFCSCVPPSPSTAPLSATCLGSSTCPLFLFLLVLHLPPSDQGSVPTW